jgi:hypothetical protein
VFGISLKMYANAHHVPLVIGAKFGQDALFLAGAFVFGHVIVWFWGLR